MSDTTPSQPVVMSTQQVQPDSAPETILGKVIRDKNKAVDLQRPRRSQWTENIDLARDLVTRNRLIQRHPVNMPMMKENELAWLSKIDDIPAIVFDCVNEDPIIQRKKEILINEHWDNEMTRMDLPIVDYLLKKNVYYTARGTVKLNLSGRRPVIHPMDPFDVVFDPAMNPWDIESARHIHHLNIFKRLNDVLNSKMYSAAGKRRLKDHMATATGIAQSNESAEQLAAKLKRLVDMGIRDFMKLIGSDQIINLTESIDELWVPAKGRYVRHVVTYAFDSILLRCIPLVDAIGVEFYPFESWTNSPSTDLIFDTGPADVQRTINKIENLWMSQKLENRTLKNFGMQYFDGTKENFNPVSFEPRPFGWYPVPGKPSDVVSKVEIGDVGGDLQDMEYFKSLAARAIAVTETDKGIGVKGIHTKFEIEALLSSSQAPANNTAKFYNAFWRRVGEKWFELTMANYIASDKTKLTRRGANGINYFYDMRLSELDNKDGYNVKVKSVKQSQGESKDKLTKLTFAQKLLVGNPIASAIVNEKILETLDVFDPGELEEITKALKATPPAPIAPAGNGAPTLAPA